MRVPGAAAPSAARRILSVIDAVVLGLTTRISIAAICRSRGVWFDLRPEPAIVSWFRMVPFWLISTMEPIAWL